MASASSDELPQDQADRGRVLVNCFSQCSCADFELGAPHLSSLAFEVELRHGKAIALSYAIGDFDRARHIFGHFAGEPNRILNFEFGGEWEIRDLQNTLVELSQRKGAIWFDQFSISQNANDIHIQLQRIPDIYGCLEVVILLPNAPCPCLREAFQLYEEGIDFVDKDVKFDFHYDKVQSNCLNAIPVSSYQFRVWTKQEFIYARHISVHCCGGPAASCSNGLVGWRGITTMLPEGAENYMGKYSKWCYGRCLTAAQLQPAYARQAAWSTFMQHMETGVGTWADLVRSFEARRNEKADAKAYKWSYRGLKFLLGECLRRNRSATDDKITFLEHQGQQSATVKRDFALAIFAAVKPYQIPETFHTMILPELVDDGILQWEVHKERFVMSLLPQGLFENEPGTIRCVTSHYLDKAKVRTLNDIYGPIQGRMFVPITDMGHVMIRIMGEARPPASRIMRSQTYKNAFRDRTTNFVHDFIMRVSRQRWYSFGRNTDSWTAWARAVMWKRVPAPRTKEDWPSIEHQKALFREYFFAGQYFTWDDLSLPEMDHYEVVYRLMCDWAGIDIDMAKQKELGLVVALTDPPCLGLFNDAAYRTLEASESECLLAQVTQSEISPSIPGEGQVQPTPNHEDALDPADWLSVLVSDPSEQLGIVYETVLWPDMEPFDTVHVLDLPPKPEPLPVYAVIGVWYDSDTGDPLIGAQMAYRWDKECNALLL